MPVRFLARKSNSPVAEAEVAIEPNLNLLAHAQLEELDIGSECGGHGRCGGDRLKVRVTDAAQSARNPHLFLSPITEAERRHLTTEQLDSGWRLGCQCWPNPGISADTRIECELREDLGR